MGIKRLFPVLSPFFEDAKMTSLQGKTIGVDGMGWLYQSYFCNYESSKESYIGILRQLELKINLMNEWKLDVR